MPTDTTFRLSTYLTLGLACVIMTYAEGDVLPEVGFLAVAALIALAVLFRLETRIPLLSIPAANRLGSIIGLIAFVWGAFRLNWERAHNEYEKMPWQLMCAAMFGLLLMSLILAKLARREKHAGDYWWLHCMALVMVILAGAIVEDLVCFALILLYAALATWSLRLFYLRQSSGQLWPIPGRPVAVPIEGVITSHNKSLGIRRALVAAVVAAAFALPLYLITPRSSAEKLSFGQPRVEIGYAADQMTNLKLTGDLKPNQDIAFEVTASTGDIPKLDLSPEQRWQGRILREYRSGVWRPGEPNLPLPAIDPGPKSNLDHSHWTPPNLGKGECTLSFSVQSRLHGEFLADPVVWASGEPVPIATLTSSGLRGWTWSRDGTFYWNFSSQGENHEPIRYVQAWRPEADPDLSPAFHITVDNERKMQAIRDCSVPKIKDYAETVIREMVASGQLPSNWQDPVRLAPRADLHDRIARAFAAHLATTPTLVYSTKLRRENTNIDPIEDFLFHTRSGHCERFASALALMLRSQGIPAVLVLGFKGCEAKAEPGHYVVRQEYAHAWVAALIQDFEPSPIVGGRPLSRWRSLDPTPTTSATDESVSENQAEETVGSWLERQFRNYISGYSREQRQRALKAIVAFATRTETLLSLAILSCGVLVMRLFRRRRRKTVDSPAISSPPAKELVKLFASLRLCGFIPQAGETAWEFASRTTRTLQQNPHTLCCAELPRDWVQVYYEMRFGNKTISPDQISKLEARLDEMVHLMKPVKGSTVNLS